MQWTEITVMALLTAAATIGLGHLAAEWAARPAQAAGRHVEHGWGHASWYGGWRHGGRETGWTRLCRDPASLDLALGYIKSELSLTAEQTPDWARLAAAIRDASDRLRVLCGDDAASARDAAGRLAAAENRLAAGLDWLKEVRPAFDRFYRQLDERQRTLLDTRMKQGHGHR